MRADMAYLDLGMSSMQVDTRERGFSYAYDAPLDMRMDPEQELTAAELVNTWDRRRLARVLREYGEERYADRIAGQIVRRRPLETTFELVDAITAAIPAPARFAGGHPAKRSFQAIRIAVNEELAQLDAALPLAWDVLRVGGRLAAISFHSLEDRRVKRFLDREGARVHLPARPARVRRAAARPRPSRCSGARSRRRPARSRTTRARSRPACGPPASSGRSSRCPPRPPPPAPDTPADGRARTAARPAAPRRVSGPLRPAPAGAPPLRRGNTGVFERLRALPETRVVDGLLRGRVWIWLIGMLLGGIVAMQVSLLKLNAGISRAVTTAGTLERQNADIEADIGRLSSAERVREAAARRRHDHARRGRDRVPARAARPRRAARRAPDAAAERRRRRDHGERRPRAGRARRDAAGRPRRRSSPPGRPTPRRPTDRAARRRPTPRRPRRARPAATTRRLAAARRTTGPPSPRQG